LNQQADSKGNFHERITYGNLEANLNFLNKCGVEFKNKKILEIGSGIGSMTKYLLDQGYNVTGIDINEEYIKKARRIYGDEIPILKVESAKLPFEDNSFDIAMSFDVFEHIPDSDEHLQEVYRVLKSGGIYVLQTPNKYTNSVFETFSWRSLEWKKDHCSLHSYNGILKRFNKNGFSVKFVDIPVVTGFFKDKINAYMGKVGLKLIEIINPDKFPDFLKTNFFIVAHKI